jgi:hypothetical protein
MSEHDVQELRIGARRHLALVWEMAQLTDQVEDVETTRLIKILKEHPEYYEVWDHLEEYGDEDVEIDGVSPILHVNIHGTIENQLADDTPPFVAKALLKLTDNGVSRHEAIHVIGNALAEQIWTMMAQGQEYDQEKYRHDVNRYVSERLAWEAELGAKTKHKKKKARRARRRKRQVR